jgi:hypothetical protein
MHVSACCRGGEGGGGIYEEGGGGDAALPQPLTRTQRLAALRIPALVFSAGLADIVECFLVSEGGKLLAATFVRVCHRRYKRACAAAARPCFQPPPPPPPPTPPRCVAPGIMLPNVAVVANRMLFDDGPNGRLTGFKDPLLTSVRLHSLPALIPSLAAAAAAAAVTPLSPGQQKHIHPALLLRFICCNPGPSERPPTAPPRCCCTRAT